MQEKTEIIGNEHEGIIVNSVTLSSADAVLCMEEAKLQEELNKSGRKNHRHLGCIPLDLYWQMQYEAQLEGRELTKQDLMQFLNENPYLKSNTKSLGR